MVCCVILFSSLLYGCRSGSDSARSDAAERTPAPLNSENARVPGEYLIQVKGGTADPIKIIRDALGGWRIRMIKGLGNDTYQVGLATDPGPAAVKRAFEGNDAVLIVQPNYIFGF